jgi:hypothetical protein
MEVIGFILIIIGVMCLFIGVTIIITGSGKE